MSNDPHFHHTKDPGAVLDFSFDWTKWLAPLSDIITASVWVVEPTGSLVVTINSFSNTITTVWLDGGIAGTDYRVTNKITTNAGRKDERSFYIHCQDR